MSAATKLLAAASQAALWHTPDQEPYATIPVRSHFESWPVRSRRFRNWLSGQYFLRHGEAAHSEAMTTAVSMLEGRAIHGGDEHSVYTRVAGVDGGGLLYLDLCNDAWEVIEIDGTGWRVIPIADAPVRFRRSSGMRPLSYPKRNGSLAVLRPFLNLSSNGDFSLFVGCLLGGFRDSGPYPILCLHGEEDSAKSTTARIYRALLDPNAAPIRAEPRSAQDLMIAARNGWVLAFDNLSHLAPWLSDALCRLSTGGGWATRALYTDHDEIIIEAQRPVVLTGINELATRGDLLSRTIQITQPPIEDSKRRAEAAFWAEFEEAQPAILGALFDALACAIRDEPGIELDSLPRMADFARWVAAAEEKLPWPKGQFLAAYAANRQMANDAALEASPVAAALQNVMIDSSAWEGTATQLLERLDGLVSDETRRLKAWPRTARSLSAALRRLAPNLRRTGLHVDFGQTEGPGSRKVIRLLQAREFIDACDASDAGPAGNGSDASQTAPGVAGVAEIPTSGAPRATDGDLFS